MLARVRSFVKASEELNITQSALTRSIQALESEYQIKLFDRSRLGVFPTSSGRLLLERAESILSATRSLESDLRLIQGNGWGRVAFGIGPLPARVVLPTLLTDFAQNHAGVQIDTEINGARYLFDHLRDERIEFLLCSTAQLREGVHPNFTVSSLGALPLTWVVRAGHPLTSQPATQKGLTVANFAHVGGTRLTQSSPDDPTFMISCDDYESLRHVTLHSDVIWITSQAMIQRELVDGTLVELPHPISAPAQTELALVEIAGRSRSPSAEMVIGKIRTILGS